MKFLTLFRLFSWMLVLLFGGALHGYDVLVSVAPHRYFVEKIADKTLDIGLIVPAGASSHTYEPTPRQMIEAGKARIWFQIGESFETRAGLALRGNNPKLELVDLQKGLNLIHEHHCHHGHNHHHGCIDPHFWLSAIQAKIQATTIAHHLVSAYPQHEELYLKNLDLFLTELDQLQKEMTTILEPLKKRTIMVSHPAYAYLCRDFNLKQLSIEFEGKDPTPQQLTSVIQQAKRDGINKIFVQMQYSNKGAKLIAHELGAEVIVLDPYAENYKAMMLDIAHAFANN